MPRGKRPGESPEQQQHNAVVWGQYGKRKAVEFVTGWDLKPVIVQAMLEVVASGCTLVFRPGSGGGSIGIAIWEKDYRHEPEWLYNAEAVDDWATEVVKQAEGRRSQAAD